MTDRLYFPRPGSVTLQQADALVSQIRKYGVRKVSTEHPLYSHTQVVLFYRRNKELIDRDETAA